MARGLGMSSASSTAKPLAERVEQPVEARLRLREEEIRRHPAAREEIGSVADREAPALEVGEVERRAATPL